MNAMTEFKSYSTDDRAALNELKAYIAAKLGIDVTTIKAGDVIAAVTPGLITPDYLKNV